MYREFYSHEKIFHNNEKSKLTARIFIRKH